MALAMYWGVRVGRDEAFQHPTPLEKKLKPRLTRIIRSFRKLYRRLVSWFTRGLR